MRFHAFLMAACLALAPQAARAAEHAITVTDIHNFVAQTNSVLNGPDAAEGRAYLKRIVHDNAIFQNHTAFFNSGGSPYMSVHYPAPVMTTYYRYPYGGGMMPVSLQSMDKWDYMNVYNNKKNMIYGYLSDASILRMRTAVNNDPSYAIVDIDIKEYSMGYAAGAPDHMMRVMHENAKCKMHLHEDEAGIRITRMDCNVNSSLPF